MTDATLGAALDRLLATVEARAAQSPETSYTARLLAKGAEKCAQKLGEEGVELALAATRADAEARRTGVRGEAADLLYHLAVLLKAADVSPGEVAAELARREGVSGLDEKASRAAEVPASEVSAPEVSAEAPR